MSLQARGSFYGQSWFMRLSRCYVPSGLRVVIRGHWRLLPLEMQPGNSSANYV